MRIVSLLPSATDIVAALGAGDDLVGVSHSCSGDWGHLPRLTSTWIDKTASQGEIDSQVRTATRPLYQLDIDTLERLAPDVVISQSLCDVCAVPSGDVREAVLGLPSQPVLVDLSPFCLADVPRCFDQVASAIARPGEAAQLAARWDDALARLRGRHVGGGLRVVFLDWIDPPFVAGHWIPDMLELLGITALMGQSGERSFTTSWQAIDQAGPDLVIVACCGIGEDRARAAGIPLDRPVLWLDGHLHFSRPSPALLPSLEMLSDAVAGFMELA